MELLLVAEKAVHGDGISALERTLEELWGRIRPEQPLWRTSPQCAFRRERRCRPFGLIGCGRVRDPRFLREAWHMMAYALTANEQWVEAITYYRQAIPAFDQEGETQRAARMRLGLISSLSLTGQSQEALAVAAEAEQIFRHGGDNASLAKLATNLGAVYQRLDDYERAVECHFEAAELFNQIGNERALAQAYLNLGSTLCFQDRFAESEEMYAKCDEIAARLNWSDLRAHAAYNKAYVYFLSAG